MSKGIGFLSLLLFALSSHAAVDNQLIQSLEASRITLAGDIGAVAMYSVQADDDDDLEIFATASSTPHDDISNIFKTYNDHWLLLDRNAEDTDYKIIARGELQETSKEYSSAYQVNFQKILLGDKRGALTTIEFVDNKNVSQHTITSKSRLLSSLPRDLAENSEVDRTFNSIVSLTGTDQNEYIVLCAGYAHIYDEAEEVIHASSQYSHMGTCLTGNVDYQKIDSQFDEELLSSYGYVYTFDGSNFQEKTEFYNLFSFGYNSRIANIDDDPAQEVLDQPGSNWTGVEYRSIMNGGDWIELSATQNAFKAFYTVDLNNDGIDEILFDYIDTEEPHESKIVQVSWDTDLHSHIIQNEVISPHLSLASIKYLPTTLTGNSPSNYYLFASSKTVVVALDPLPDGTEINPLDHLLVQLNSDLTVSWSGLTKTAARSFETIARTQAGNTLSDFSLIQLEQTNLDGDQDYHFTFKKFDISSFDMVEVTEPDYSDDQIMSIQVFSAFDFDEDGIDELHIGGQATYADPSGIVLSSNLDGSDHNRLDALFTDIVSNLYVGDINHSLTPDIFALGNRNDGERGLSYMYYFDDTSSSYDNYEPPYFVREVNKAIPLNIKGDDEFEILGITGVEIGSEFRNLYSYNPNAVEGESEFYQQSYQDLTNFSPIRLNNREYDFTLASSESGMLYLIEPKDMDILTSVQACDDAFSIINNIRIGNNVDVALAVCGQSLKAWVIEYDETILHYGYELVELGAYDLGNVTTDEGQLMPLITDEGTFLIGLFKNQYIRLAVNTSSVGDEDNDGYLNYQDYFPAERTQWADADLDGIGDNQGLVNGIPAVDPDPSLNDRDNDGIADNLDPNNDIDHGYPIFTEAPLDTIKVEYTAELTNVSLLAPKATDIYDEFNGNGTPPVSAKIAGNTLANKLDDDQLELAGEFVAELISGRHNITWSAQDLNDNITTTTQEVWVYPSVSFESAEQRIGETQTAGVKVILSGASPEYPVNVTINVTSGDIANNDVDLDISQTLTVSFEEGETESILELSFTDDQVTENDEILELTIVDNFDSSPGNESLTVNDSQNVHTLTVADLNDAPTISHTIEQNGQALTNPNNIDGTITITSNVIDTNASDSHSYSWNLAAIGLGSNILLPVASIDPAEITPGQYTLTLTVTDNGLPTITTVETIQLILDYGDSDNDGTLDNLDAFPNDPYETMDSDGDGIGDNADEIDGDNGGDNNSDSDGDGVNDETDAFPNDSSETIDTDGDGIGDNADDYPRDASKTSFEDERDVDSSGSMYFYLLLLFPLLYRRRR